MVLKIILFIIFVLILSYNLNKINKKIENYQSNRTKVIIIVPIRDREIQLKNFLKNKLPVLKYQNIDYKIFIIEQSDKKKFNKGKLNNIGFLESIKKYQDIDYIYFNDVDNYVLKKDIINFNSKIDNINHYYGHLHCLGGIYSFNKKIYRKINGFSNNFFGWGFEDEDLVERIRIFNIKINRDNFILRGKEDNKIYDDKSNIVSRHNNNNKLKSNYKKKYLKNKNYIYKDGLNTCKYKILSNKLLDKNIFRILVEI